MENTVSYHKETGLLFLKDIPFTKERTQALISLVSVNQFNINIVIEDKSTGTKAEFSKEDIKKLADYVFVLCHQH